MILKLLLRNNLRSR